MKHKNTNQKKFRSFQRKLTAGIIVKFIVSLTVYMILLLLALLIALPFVADGESTLTLNRVGTFGVLYIGLRNLIELGATVYWDRQL